VKPPNLIEPLPDLIRCLNLFGVKYWIHWEAMNIGDSVFIKTSADLGLVNKQLRSVRSALRLNFVAQQRCEFGKLGIRIWRMP
jgi:hypothetical protein